MGFSCSKAEYYEMDVGVGHRAHFLGVGRGDCTNGKDYAAGADSKHGVR